MAILQLQDEGKLSVQDPFCKIIANCPTQWKSITIHELLSNSSGIVSFTQLPGFNIARAEAPESIVAMTRVKSLLFQPGTQFGYSNTDYLLLGLVVEAVSGESYATFLRTHILDPLAMKDSGLLLDGSKVSQLAKGYEQLSRSKRVDATTPWSAGGMYSTVNDLYAWDRAVTADKLATRRSLREMLTPYVAVPPETEIGYGYGWLIGPLWNHHAIFHGGGSLGYESVNLIFPAVNLTVIVLSNQGGTDIGSIESAIVPLLLAK